MPYGRLSKRAPFSGALFAFFAVALTLSGPAVAASGCAADRIDARVRIMYVFDGDTVQADDGRRIRLIGLNTPELGRDDKPAEPYAREARERLQNLLRDQDHSVGLRYDAERKDRYGRLLAHAYFPDGSSVAEQLLEQGLATSLAVPPNVWNLDCYRDAERRASSARRGVWSLPEYQAVDSRKLGADAQGYRRVQGRVLRIGKGSKSVWLNLEGGVAIRIDRKDLEYFQGLPLERLRNHTVLVRGWTYSHRGEPRIRVRHPAALQVVD